MLCISSPRYHKVCEEFMKINDTILKLDFGECAWARACECLILGQAQSFYPQIPFSSQPQFREPINQGLWEKHPGPIWWHFISFFHGPKQCKKVYTLYIYIFFFLFTIFRWWANGPCSPGLGSCAGVIVSAPLSHTPWPHAATSWCRLTQDILLHLLVLATHLK